MSCSWFERWWWNTSSWWWIWVGFRSNFQTDSSWRCYKEIRVVWLSAVEMKLKWFSEIQRFDCDEKMELLMSIDWISLIFLCTHFDCEPSNLKFLRQYMDDVELDLWCLIIWRWDSSQFEGSYCTRGNWQQRRQHYVGWKMKLSSWSQLRNEITITEKWTEKFVRRRSNSLLMFCAQFELADWMWSGDSWLSCCSW